MRRLWALLPSLRPYYARIASLLLLSATVSLMAVPIPSLYRRFVDGVTNRSAGSADVYRSLFAVAGVYIFLVLLKMVLGIVQSRVNAGFSKDIGAQIRVRTMRHVFGTSLFALESRGVGTAISVVNTDSNNVARLCCDLLIPGVGDLLLVTIVAIAMVNTSWPLALCAASALPILMMARALNRESIQKMHLEMRQCERTVNGRLAERLRHVRLVKHGVKTNDEVDWFTVEFARLNRLFAQIGLKRATVTVINNAAGLLLSFLFMGFGGYLILEQQMTAGKFCEVLGYVGLLHGALTRLTTMITAIEDNTPAIDCLYSYHFDPSTREMDRADAPLPAVRGRVEFRNVDFSYPIVSEDVQVRRNVLDGATFAIEPGEMVAIIGANGSGKSTIASLLLRFYHPSAGQVLIDGNDISQFDISSLRRVFGVAEETPRIFKGTIRESITYINPRASSEDVASAGRLVGLDRMVAPLRKGYDTPIGEDGFLLSGGQRQRISVARTLLHRPRILILDEALSSIDNVSEMAILGRIKALPNRPTILAFTHNWTSLKLFDRVFEVKQGEVSEVSNLSAFIGRAGREYDVKAS
jgi:ATP-binding cassette, subfamily B, bacterial